MHTAECFNQSAFGRFIISPAGRIFRIAAGTAYFAIGYHFRKRPLGVAAMALSLVPLSSGLFDLCYLSAALGGPLSGAKIRKSVPQEM